MRVKVLIFVSLFNVNMFALGCIVQSAAGLLTGTRRTVQDVSLKHSLNVTMA